MRSSVLLIDVFYAEYYDAFICAVYGKCTLQSLESIEKDLNENLDFDKGFGTYKYEARYYLGQYGFEGRCEIAPGWELVEIEYTPLEQDDTL